MSTINKVTQRRNTNTQSGLVEPIKEREDESNISDRGGKESDDDDFGRTDDVIDLSKVDCSTSSNKQKAKSLLPEDYETNTP